MKLNRLFLLIGIILLSTQTSTAQTCIPCQINSSWQHTTGIVIDNSTNPAALSNYQILITIDTQTPISNTEMNVDGSDLRFTDHCTDSIQYYIESGINTANTNIWIKVPSIAANSIDTIYMIYGNPIATPYSNVDSTFDFYDGFDGSSLDLTKWEVRGTPNYSFNAGIMTFYGNSNWEYIRSNVQFIQPEIIEETHAKDGPSFGFTIGLTGTDNRFTFRTNSPNLGCTYDNDVSGGNAWFDQNYPNIEASSTSVQFYDYKIIAGISGTNILMQEYCNQTTLNCNTTPTTLSTFTGTSFYIGYSSYAAGYTGYANSIRARKYSAIVPTTSLQNTFVPPVVDLGNDTSFCASGILDAENSGSTFLWNDLSSNQTLNVASPGTYSVTVTDANSCSASDNITISINTLPNVNLGADTTICSGNYLTLDAQNPGSTYLWNNGNTTQTLNASITDTYTVFITDINGCENTDTIDVNVFTIDNGTTLASETITANAVFCTYQWIDCNNSNQPIATETNMNFTATLNGSYAVIIYQMGCIDTSACVTINSVGLENIYSDISNIFPNPSNGFTYIEVEKEGYYQITNMLGQIMETIYLYHNTINLVDLNNLISGIYFVSNVGSNETGSNNKIAINR